MSPAKKSPTPRVLPWQDYINASTDVVDTIVEKYGFHELDREAILEENQYARIDSYDDYIFMVLHFPKYDINTERYLYNEFNIFVSKEYVLTFRYFQTGTIKKLQEKYENLDPKEEIPHAGMILYEIIEGMLDHVMRMIEKFHRDLKWLETDLFEAKDGSAFIRSIMIRKRNIITIKHMIKPQIQAMHILELRIKQLFWEEMESYFENLQDKLEKIYSEALILHENIDSMEDTLKSIFELKTNTTIQYLTLFSAFFLPLTLVTGFFGMNIEAWHFHDLTIVVSVILTLFVLIVITYIFTKKNRI